MVKRVVTPVAQAMFTNKDLLLERLAERALDNYSIDVVVANKLTSRNLKKPFRYNSTSKYHNTYKKLCELLLAKLIEGCPYLRDNLYSFSPTYPSRHVFLTMHFIQDKSVRRYLRRLDRGMRLLSVPLTFTVTDESPGPVYGLDRNGLQYNFNRLRVCLTLDCGLLNIEQNLYRIFPLIPQALKVLETLSRKQVFTNQEIRSLNTRIVREKKGSEPALTLSNTEKVPSLLKAPDALYPFPNIYASTFTSFPVASTNSEVIIANLTT